MFKDEKGFETNSFFKSKQWLVANEETRKRLVTELLKKGGVSTRDREFASGFLGNPNVRFQNPNSTKVKENPEWLKKYIDNIEDGVQKL